MKIATLAAGFVTVRGRDWALPCSLPCSLLPDAVLHLSNLIVHLLVGYLCGAPGPAGSGTE